MASTKKGSKPDFHGAAGGEGARELYNHFFAKVQELYDPCKVKNGVFQAMMEGKFKFRSACPILSLTTSSEHTELWACECGLFQSRRSGILISFLNYINPLSNAVTDDILQVTLEIETSCPKSQEKGKTRSDTIDEEYLDVAEPMQMPPELLE